MRNFAAKNLASWTDSAQTTTFEIDTHGQLRQVSAGGQTVGYLYLYDSLGRRVARTVNGALDQGWVFDDSNHPVARLDDLSAWSCRFRVQWWSAFDQRQTQTMLTAT